MRWPSSGCPRDYPAVPPGYPPVRETERKNSWRVRGEGFDLHTVGAHRWRLRKETYQQCCVDPCLADPNPRIRNSELRIREANLLRYGFGSYLHGHFYGH